MYSLFLFLAVRNSPEGVRIVGSASAEKNSLGQRAAKLTELLIVEVTVAVP